MFKVGCLFCRPKHDDRVLDRVADDPGVQEGWRGKAGFHAVPHQGEECFPEAVDVQEDDWLGMQVEAFPGQELDDFFQSSDTARRNHESVRLVVHQLLALVHGGDDDGFHLVEQPLPAAKKGWHDADDPSACGMGSAGRGPHQADPAAAVHEPPSGPRSGRTEGPGSLGVDGIGRIGRTTEQADGRSVKRGDGNGQCGHETSEQGAEDRSHEARYLERMSNVVKVGMTRPIVMLVLATVLATMASCGQAPQDSPVADVKAEGWVEAPVIDRARRDAGGLRVSGLASPGSRIVIRGDARAAFAVGTGEDGRFDLLVPAPQTDTLYVVEIQAGEDVVPAAARLLVAGDPAGPVALISAGAATVRLDPGTGLDVIDSDGRTRIVSGRAAAGRRVAITVDGEDSVTVTANAAGRWMLNLGASGPAAFILSVDGVTHAYSGAAKPDVPLDRLMPDGNGVTLIWSLSDTARQSSWFPGRREAVQGRQPG